jgi:hypothetical protein
MKFVIPSTFFFSCLLACQSTAFQSPSFVNRPTIALQQRRPSSVKSILGRSSSLRLSKEDSEREDEEIERLRKMAAKLRAEAAALEAQKSQQLAEAAERAFQKFDTNKDGKISFEELKEGLEKAFKTELPEKRVRQLMDDFDKTGEGSIRLDEFVTVEQFRNRLDALAREEKRAAQESVKLAKKEEEAYKFVQAQLELINDRPPTPSDKILSILPYLFPLLDGLQFAKFLVLENPENPISLIIGIAYALYRAIPFGGLIAFFALSFLSGNPSINRLIRFNMSQAIYIDIALFFPGLIAAVYELLAPGSIPIEITALGSDVLFGVLLLTLGYATVSSLLGITPNKIPLISSTVEARIPTVDMFDEQGRFQPRNFNKDGSKQDKEKDDEQK